MSGSVTALVESLQPCRAETDWNRVLQLPSLTRLQLEGCGMPWNPSGSPILVPDREETIYQMVLSNPIPWERLRPSKSLERLEISNWMVSPSFAPFIDRSQIRTLVLHNWSYPQSQVTDLPKLLSAIDPRVRIVLPREYMPLGEPFWATVIGEERERFVALTEFEAWASTRSNLKLGIED